MSLSNKQIDVLEAQDEATLATWWCELNNSQWPSQLPRHGDSTSIQVMESIMRRIGHRRCNREWNRELMTDEEHNDFWRGTFEGDAEAKKRYEA